MALYTNYLHYITYFNNLATHQYYIILFWFTKFLIQDDMVIYIINQLNTLIALNRRQFIFKLICTFVSLNF